MHQRTIKRRSLFHGHTWIERKLHHRGSAAADQEDHEVLCVRLLQSVDDPMRGVARSRVRHRVTSLPSFERARQRAHLAWSHYDCLELDTAWSQLRENYLRGWHRCLADRDHEHATEIGQAIVQINESEPAFLAAHCMREDFAHAGSPEGFTEDLAEHRAPRGVEIGLRNRPR